MEAEAGGMHRSRWGEGEARIVELDDNEDDLVASENGIATLDV